MIVVDTNILTRYYTKDDPAQSPLALAIMMSPSIHISKTVVLEFAQIMHHVYKFPSDQIYSFVEHLAGLPNVTLECEDQINEALRNCRNGLDFGDALHLAGSYSCAKFATFVDKKFAKRAARLGLQPPCYVPTKGISKNSSFC